jgi:hypothetical protein
MSDPVYHCRYEHFIFDYFAPPVKGEVCSNDCGLFSSPER